MPLILPRLIDERLVRIRREQLAEGPPAPTKAERDAAARAQLAQEQLLDFIPWASPSFQQPRHLQPLVDVLHDIRDGKPQIRVGIAAPPQHEKSETVCHAIAWFFRSNPALRIGYATYSAALSHRKSRRALAITRAAGVALNRDVQAAKYWETATGGGMLAEGLTGGFTGNPLDILFVDDAFKNRLEAESPVMRERAWDFLKSAGETRMSENGAIVVFMARWHEDDLIARMQKHWGSPYIRLPAISDEGKPLLPRRFSLAELRRKEKRLGAYDFESLYQGRPRARGAKVFEDMHFYDELPTEHYREGVGVDLTYTAKTSSHHSIALVGRAIGDGEETSIYLDRLFRRQCRVKEFRGVLKDVRADHPGASMLFYASTTERGTAELMDDDLGEVGLRAELAAADKLTRANKASVAWNDKPSRILCPSEKLLKSRGESWNEPPWSDFRRVVLAFTGVKDAEDDDVDALAALHDVLADGVGDFGVELGEEGGWEGLAARGM